MLQPWWRGKHCVPAAQCLHKGSRRSEQNRLSSCSSQRSEEATDQGREQLCSAWMGLLAGASRYEAGLIYVTMQQLNCWKVGTWRDTNREEQCSHVFWRWPRSLPYISNEVGMHQCSLTEHNVRGTDVTRGGSVCSISDLKLSYTSFCSVSLTFMTLWFRIYSHILRPDSSLRLCLSFLVLKSFSPRDARLLLYGLALYILQAGKGDSVISN